MSENTTTTFVPPLSAPVSGIREYRYTMGFRVNGIPIPDPAGFDGAVSDLDTSAGRDATGTLHRNKVATKHPMKFVYNNIEWEMFKAIAYLIKEDKFQFTFFSPATCDFQTITAYVGDREWKSVWCPADGEYLCNMIFSIIEY